MTSPDAYEDLALNARAWLERATDIWRSEDGDDTAAQAAAAISRGFTELAGLARLDEHRAEDLERLAENRAEDLARIGKFDAVQGAAADAVAKAAAVTSAVGRLQIAAHEQMQDDAGLLANPGAADRQLAIVKAHYQRRCDNLTKARDERQARIDAALQLVDRLVSIVDYDGFDGAASQLRATLAEECQDEERAR